MISMTWSFWARILCIYLVVTTAVSVPVAAQIDFWDEQRKGANGDGGAVENGDTTPEAWFAAASAAGLEYVRLIPVEWVSEGRDFLLGNADNYTTIPEADLNQLMDVLDIAHRQNVKIVLTMFSLPGARNRQENGGVFDYRLWTDEGYQTQAISFWKSLAAELKGHPALVGYNPLNEPHPERKDGFDSLGKMAGIERWLEESEGTAADLNRFNRRIVQAIRSEDAYMPIILEGWFHADPEGVRFLDPIDDPAILYSFHTYGDWNFATYRVNNGQFAYPDKMPGAIGQATRAWSEQDMRDLVGPVVQWSRQHGIPSSRIMASEFGCDRRVAGAKDFLEDLIAIFDEYNWHWAFYSFRSSTWDGLDYELGTKKLGWKYWEKREAGVSHESLIERKDNPLWEVFKTALTHN